MKQFCLGIIVAAGLALSAFGQGVDPLIGTWKFNPAKSTATGQWQLAKSQTNIWSGEGQNLIDTTEGVDAQGQPFKVVFRHIYDGMPHPTTGSPDVDSSAYTRNGNTITTVRYKQGKIVEVGYSVIVPGQTITIAAEGITANNQSYHYVMVFDKQ
jgi:hypothetical protein